MKLLKSNPELADVKERLDRMAAESDALARGWREKQEWLLQCHQLQLFNKEADNIDAVTSAHQAFLEFSDLGVSGNKMQFFCLFLYLKQNIESSTFGISFN